MALLGDAGLASVRRGDALLGNANQCKTKEFFDEGNQNPNQRYDTIAL